jgi:hypothetical protein
LSPILEKTEMFDDSLFNLNSPVLLESTSQQVQVFQLERKMEKMQSELQNSIYELKALIVK